MRAAERRAWAARVLAALEPSLAGRHVVVLAGERYREHLFPALRARGCSVKIPLEGLRFGEQLHWFAAQREDR